MLQVEVAAGVQSALVSFCTAVLLGKGKLNLQKKQVLETLFNIEKHFKLAKSFNAARGGNPIPTCSFQPPLFVYTSVMHVVMKNPRVLEPMCIYFARWVVTGISSLSSYLNISSGWSEGMVLSGRRTLSSSFGLQQLSVLGECTSQGKTGSLL